MQQAGAPRRLLVMRHAAASHRIGGSDHRRPLSAAGERELPAIRAWLAPRADGIRAVYVSSAVRATSTLHGVCDALPATASIVRDDALYGAGAQTWIDRCRQLDEAVPAALLVGHNPGLEGLVHELAPAAAGESPTSLPRGFPPGTLAVLSVAVPWQQLGFATCAFEEVRYPTSRP